MQVTPSVYVRCGQTALRPAERPELSQIIWAVGWCMVHQNDQYGIPKPFERCVGRFGMPFQRWGHLPWHLLGMQSKSWPARQMFTTKGWYISNGSSSHGQLFKENFFVINASIPSLEASSLASSFLANPIHCSCCIACNIGMIGIIRKLMAWQI